MLGEPADSMSVASSSLQGATLLISLQVLSRLLTFILNQSLLRFLSPALLGISAQLELFSISILFFARESLRVALQRQSGKAIQPIVNIAYVPFLLGIPLTLSSWLLATGSGLSQTPHMHTTLNVQALATLLELLSEPLFAVTQFTLRYTIRASAEGLATTLKCLTTFAAFSYAHQHALTLGALPFALGQLAYASTLLLVYLYRVAPLASTERFTLLPTPLPTPPRDTLRSYLPRPLVSLALALYAQSTLKYLLTQGDALLITLLAPLADQGAYALAANYGGLAARLFFQPIEESSRTLFARRAATPAAAAATLTSILTAYTLLSLPLLALAPPLAPALLAALTGPRFAPAAPVLTATVATLPLLALNGVLEAFVAAVATPRDLRAQSTAMAVFSVVFGLASWALLAPAAGLGARGLVLANAANMALRVGWSGWFVARWCRERGVAWEWRRGLPSGMSVGTAMAVMGVMRQCEGWFGGVVGRMGWEGSVGGHALVGQLVETGLAGVGLLVGMAVGEREVIAEWWRWWKERQEEGSGKKSQ